MENSTRKSAVQVLVDRLAADASRNHPSALLPEETRMVIEALRRWHAEESEAADVAPEFADAVSRGVPEGFDTVLGYLAKRHPEVLALMDWRDPEATARDGLWLSHRYKFQVYVPACVALRNRGLMRVRAWTVDLLAERFGR